MKTNKWQIVWRDSRTGNIREVGLSFDSYEAANMALRPSLWYKHSDLTPTIEREVVEVR